MMKVVDIINISKYSISPNFFQRAKKMMIYRCHTLQIQKRQWMISKSKYRTYVLFHYYKSILKQASDCFTSIRSHFVSNEFHKLSYQSLNMDYSYSKVIQDFQNINFTDELLNYVNLILQINDGLVKYQKITDYFPVLQKFFIKSLKFF